MQKYRFAGGIPKSAPFEESSLFHTFEYFILAISGDIQYTGLWNIPAQGSAGSGRICSFAAGIDNVTIAAEIAALVSHLSEKGHPALGMDPIM